MYSTKHNIISIAKKQYFYKLKDQARSLYGLAAVQAVALLFSFGAMGMTSTSSEGIAIRESRFSTDVIVIFTILWAFYNAIILTSKAYRNTDFAFVSNRLSSNLSNMGILITGSILGGITATLYGPVIRVMKYLTVGSQNILLENFHFTPVEIIVGISASTLYIMLFCAAGYLVGTIAQLHRLFVVIFPAFILGFLFSARPGTYQAYVLTSVTEFFWKEGSLIVFFIKVLVTVSIFFALAALLSNELEVRKC